MNELSVFERQLAAGLDALAGPRHGVDASAIARSAASQGRAPGPVASRLSAVIGERLGVPADRLGNRDGRGARSLAVIVAAALITIVAFGAVAVGSGLVRLPSRVPPVPVATPSTAPSAADSSPHRTWIPTAEMQQARYFHTATVLRNGSVLVTGGINDEPSRGGRSLASAETYDPIRGSWTVDREMGGRRSGHTATLLPDGSVLVVGGFDDWAALGSAELYDPSTESWTAAGNLIEARGYHTATLLSDGRVLVAGGRSNNSSTGHALASAELYDPATGMWSATGNMVAAHTFHAATLLPSGKVLVTGASYRGYGLAARGTAELYDPATGSWTATGGILPSTEYQTATLLGDGTVLVAGGAEIVQVGCCADTWQQILASSQVYDADTASWADVGAMTQARTYHASTILPDGEVLVTGGYLGAVDGTSTFSTGVALATAELYDPASKSWTAIDDLVGRRELHVAVALPDGRVLIAGGSSGGHALATAELFGAGTGH